MYHDYVLCIMIYMKEIIKIKNLLFPQRLHSIKRSSFMIQYLQTSRFSVLVIETLNSDKKYNKVYKTVSSQTFVFTNYLTQTQRTVFFSAPIMVPVDGRRRHHRHEESATHASHLCTARRRCTLRPVPVVETYSPGQIGK